VKATDHIKLGMTAMKCELPLTSGRKEEDGRVHDLPCLRQLDLDEGIVEQAKFMGIHIIQMPELKHMSTRMLKWTFLIKVQHCTDARTLQTNEPADEFQQMLSEFQGLFGEPTIANSQNGRQADFGIKIDPNGKIPVRSAYLVAPREHTELRRQIDMSIRCRWIQPSRSNYC
jgi:hypothetical protein